MRRDQLSLLFRPTAPWLTLWLLFDFPGARDYAVGARSGGTWRGGFYETDGNGMTATVGDEVVISVTWAEVKAWVASQPKHVATRARELREENSQIQRDWPSPYPGIGRPYCWDSRAHDGDACEQCEQDRADLAAAYDALEVARRAVRERQHAWDAEFREFLDGLTEPADLLGLLEALP